MRTHINSSDSCISDHIPDVVHIQPDWPMSSSQCQHDFSSHWITISFNNLPYNHVNTDYVKRHFIFIMFPHFPLLYLESPFSALQHPENYFQKQKIRHSLITLFITDLKVIHNTLWKFSIQEPLTCQGKSQNKIIWINEKSREKTLNTRRK